MLISNVLGAEKDGRIDRGKRSYSVSLTPMGPHKTLFRHKTQSRQGKGKCVSRGRQNAAIFDPRFSHWRGNSLHPTERKDHLQHTHFNVYS